jgi:hypothetical protein
MKARQYAEALYRAAHAHNVVAHGTLVERFVALLLQHGSVLSDQSCFDRFATIAGYIVGW